MAVLGIRELCSEVNPIQSYTDYSPSQSVP